MKPETADKEEGMKKQYGALVLVVVVILILALAISGTACGLAVGEKTTKSIVVGPEKTGKGADDKTLKDAARGGKVDKGGPG